MIEQCPICASAITSKFLDAGSFSLLQCAGCGLVAADGFSENSAAYDGDEYFVEKNCYVEHWEEFCRHFDTLLDKISLFKKRGRFLDVGCGVGVLVSRALQRGFAAQGVEISPWASNFARVDKGLDVATGFLTDAAHKPASFDVVVINHVLEHVPDPGELLRQARSILKDDGLLVVGVPNIGSIMARLAGSRWASLRPEEHRWHFAPHSIRALVKKEGFRVLRFEARENHPVVGWSLRAMARRLVNCIAVATNQGEAMLVFATKSAEGPL